MNQTLISIRESFLATFPLLGGKLLNIPFVIDNSFPTAATNGKVIAFNEKYLSTLNYNQIKTLIAHELKHVLDLHHLRMRGRDTELWNSACDFVINQDLLNMGFQYFPNWLINKDYKGMNAEDVYNILSKKPEHEQAKIKKQSKESGGQVQEPTKDDGERLSDDELREEIGKGIQELSTAISAANKAIRGIEESTVLTQDTKKEKIKEYGRGIQTSIQSLNDIKASFKDWHEVLRRFLNTPDNSDYTFQSMDIETYHVTGSYTPTLHSEKVGSIALALDVSSSQSSIAKEICSEAIHILKTFDLYELPVYYVSTFIHEKTVLYSESDLKLINGGGTCFNSFFKEFSNEHNYKGLVFITDGQVDYSNWIQPNCEVLWILTRSNTNFETNVPFGECVRYT